jgi:hypothetical protein
VNVGYHVVFSVAIPILLADLIFPAQRGRPYLGRLGLAVTAGFAVLGVATLRLTVLLSQDPGYTAPVTVAGCLLAVALIALVALYVLPRWGAGPRDDEPVPQPAALFPLGAAGTIVFVTLLHVFTGAHRPAIVHGVWVLRRSSPWPASPRRSAGWSGTGPPAGPGATWTRCGSPAAR